MKKPARLFQSYVPSATLYEAKGYDHGYLSIYLPDERLARAVPFFERDARCRFPTESDADDALRPPDLSHEAA